MTTIHAGILTASLAAIVAHVAGGAPDTLLIAGVFGLVAHVLVSAQVVGDARADLWAAEEEVEAQARRVARLEADLAATRRERDLRVRLAGATMVAVAEHRLAA